MQLQVCCSQERTQVSGGPCQSLRLQDGAKSGLSQLRRVPGLWTMSKIQREERECEHLEVLDLLLALPLMSLMTLGKVYILSSFPPVEFLL